MSTLQCDSLTARYEESEESNVFTNLTMRVDHAEIVALFGPSGCGKSTLLRIIAGLETPAAGAVFLDDDDVSKWPAHKRRVGLVFQDGALFPHLDVAGNIGYGLRMQGLRRDERRARVRDLLTLMRLEGFETRSVATLSGGEQQRVSLARALAPEPRVLLLDEPFASLDTDLRVHLATEVRQILRARNTTAVIVTHDPDEASRFGDRTLRMADLLSGQSTSREPPSTAMIAPDM